MSVKCVTPNVTDVQTSSVSSSKLMNDFEFIPPPEAPVFYPTEEEFASGPLKYISKIRPEAEPHGICKIIPPKSFQPPFAVAVEEFRFTPRIQRLNELEATTRIKLNFIEQIVKFWDLQGSPVKDKIRGASFKIPNLERRALDLYNLHRIVKEEGGFEICTRERKWSKVASRMGYGANAPNRGTIASLLRQHYERILFPYDVFQSGATIGPDIDDKTHVSDEEIEDEMSKDGQNNLCEKSDKEKGDVPEKRVLRRQNLQQRCQPIFSLSDAKTENKELKKLQCYGAGPKMPGVPSEQTSPNGDSSPKVCLDDSVLMESPNMCVPLQVCLQCGDRDPIPMLLTCDNCTNTYHTHCLIPPLNDWPKGVWHCHRCLALLVQSHPQPYTHEFGFSQSQKQYTLNEFGEMADQFKTDYFNMPPHSVACSIVEREFWRLVSSMEENVVVEYGADLHTNDYGSGFPTKLTKNILPSDLEYINSAWNLNNLPIHEGSVFRHINANISGMIIPWMYVGMCFATFCWHNEDHWTYSINYLHWGEPKTWYGVPGEHAEAFERAMKRAAPELFQSQPDLLHQLVTICNPNLLMQDGVPVYRTNQQSGEFVVTFPRAYHTGFNQGLNFAEAVNFAPSDWLPIGRVCITHYSMLHRYPVFSHDELICKMANDPESLDITIAAATYSDMLRMVENEKSARLSLLEWGVTQAEREAFELLPDDERQCDFCRTTCFLSALTCSCDQGKLVCIHHKDNLCRTCLPSQHTLRYRYTLDELPIMLHRLRTRAEKFDHWAEKVQNLIKSDVKESDSRKTCTLKELKQLLNEAVTCKYPTNSKVYEDLESVVMEASKCSRAARDLLRQQEIFKKQQLQGNGTKQTETPTKRTLRSTAGRCSSSNNENINTRLTRDEISLFYDELTNFPCVIPEANQIKNLLDNCNLIAKSIEQIIDNSPIGETEAQTPFTSHHLESLLSEAKTISFVDFGSQIDLLRHKLDEVKWMEDCDNILIPHDDTTKLRQNKLELSNLRNLIEGGMKLVSNTDEINARLVSLQQMLDDANKWTEKAKAYSCSKGTNDDDQECNVRKPTIEILEALLMEVENSLNLRRLQLSPLIDRIRDNVKKARDWKSRVDAIFGSDHKHHQKALNNANVGEAPMIDIVDELVASAVGIECQLESLPNLNSTISAARTWRERLTRTFCKKNSLFPLLHVLIPRIRQSYTQVDFLSCSSKALFQYVKRHLSSHNDNDKERKNSTQLKPQKSWFETQLHGNYSRASIIEIYNRAVHEEISNILQIRERNKIKAYYVGANLIEDEEIDYDPQNIPKRFCLCSKEANDWMVQCQLCHDWFHNECIQQYSTTIYRRKKQIAQQKQEFQPQQHYLCNLCCRGRRPKIETILSLLCSLQKLPIRIFDGELLQCVAERAITWQDKARAALSGRSDIANGYSRVLQRLNSSPFHHSPISFVESPPEMLSHRPIITLDSPVKCRRKSEEIADEEATAEALLQLSTSRSQPFSHEPSSVESTHSESTLSANSPEPCTSVDLSPSKHKRKSPLTIRGESFVQPLIELSEESKKIIHDLLLEGQCLEVSLDETSYLWSIWQLAHPNLRSAVIYNSLTAEIFADSQKRKMNAADDDAQSLKKRKIIKEKSIKTYKTKKSTKKSKNSEDDLCSMKDQCLRPNVDQVNWVACDGPCGGWFHQLCIGIVSPDEIANIEQFFCSECKQNEQLS